MNKVLAIVVILSLILLVSCAQPEEIIEEPEEEPEMEEIEEPEEVEEPEVKPPEEPIEEKEPEEPPTTLPEIPELPEAEAGTYTDIKVEEAKEMIDNDQVQVIDTSSAYNFGRGHLPGAVNIHVDELGTRLNELSKSKPVLVYSYNLKNSVDGAKILAENGFTVYRLKGEYGTWWVSGYDIEK